MQELPNFAPALPEIFIAFSAIALLLLGVFRKEDATQGITVLAIVAMLFAGLLVPAAAGGRVVTFGGMFVVDGFSAFTKVLVLLASAFTMAMSANWLHREKLERFEYPVLMLLATLGMMLMISANNLMALYLGLELQSLALYVLAAYQRDSGRATEAGLKYFVLGSLASGMLLYGSSLIYGFAGTTGFDALGHSFAQGVPVGVTVGMVFVIAALAFKISAVPFHMWTPDVYEGAPTPVTAFFAVAPKIAAFSLLVRVMVGPFGDLTHQWSQVVIFISLASMALGAFGAIAQNNIKRLMAYSSIGHVGYALIGLAVGDQVGIRGVLIYLAIYLFMNVGTFAVILAMRQKGRLMEGIDDLAGLSKTHPMSAAAMAIFMFSMAGIPPLAGFWGKLYVFMAAIEKGFITLAVVGVLTSVVSAYYYLRIIKVMYFDEPVEALDHGTGKGLSFIVAFNAILIVVFTFLPSSLVSSASTAAAALFGG
ncbi:NADH-quinone oxidoreductase subunit NuoN [Telmatospirillum siberiense]|uniref:NADH-quinone oxidoreductase subunit N n=1 Tax=Telmatospirillum siberiense TaxID=382514 RepID=A0A2N3PZP4_9PROT|nr:NADH-quinone oxidoreductase subunit NuoN [Telmatospirillum siberiense]PKU25831.1 NADH-quinone oxidoreductase subunit NuoN [Telmatospirillum siberiense]